MTPRDLRRRRLALGWSVDDLAARLGVPPKRIADWEDGSRPIDAQELLEKAFDQPPKTNRPPGTTRL